MKTIAVIIGMVIMGGFVLGFSVTNPKNNQKAPVGFITEQMKDPRTVEQKWQEAEQWRQTRKMGKSLGVK